MSILEFFVEYYDWYLLSVVFALFGQWHSGFTDIPGHKKSVVIIGSIFAALIWPTYLFSLFYDRD